MFCPKCGTQLPDGSKFCRSCGASLVAAQPAEQQYAPNQEPLNQQYAPNQEPLNQQYAPNQEPLNQQYAPNQEPLNQQYAPNQQPAYDQTQYAGQQYDQTQYAGQQYDQAQQYAQPGAPAPAAKAKSKAPAIIAAAVALVAVGTGAFFGIRALTKDDKDDDDDDDKKSKKTTTVAEPVEDDSAPDEIADDPEEERPAETTTTTTTTTTATEPEPVEVVDDTSTGGKVYNIRIWNTEFKDRFETYYWPNRDQSLWDGVELNWITVSNESNSYQNALDDALRNQDYADDDEKLDLFLVEADYAKKYVDAGVALDVLGEVGLTNSDLANQYQYTKDVMTDNTGTLRGVSWQACPGLFLYNAKYARAVLGTDDPNEVQAMLSDWDKFEETAQKMKENGIYMLSGFDDAYRCFSNNVSSPWVTDGIVNMDPQLRDWAELTRHYTDMGYNNQTSMWSDAWSAGQKIDGKTFGYFYSSWGIAFTLIGNTGDEGYGEWRACEGPQSYFWGGTWICGCTGSDNVDITRDIMLKLTCDADIMAKITEEQQDYTNNKAAIAKLVSAGYSNPFLGGQDHLSLLSSSADHIDMSNKISAYDQGCNEKFQWAMRSYFLGESSYEEALDQFKRDISSVYPELDFSF